MKKDKKILFSVLIVAFLIRILFVIIVPQLLRTDASEYDNLAISIAAGHGFVNESGVPTSFRPPFYPAFLALIYYTFGHNVLMARIIQAIIGVLTCLLIYLIAKNIFGEKIARVSTLISAVYPVLIIYTGYLLTETLFTFLLALTILSLLKTCNSTGFFPWIISGIVLGLSMLTKPMIGIFVVFIFCWLFLRKDQSILSLIKRFGLLVICSIIVIIPWTIRNYFVHHAFVPIANEGGITFYSSYIVSKRGFDMDYLKNVDDEYYKLKNEVEQSRFLFKETINFIKNNPGQLPKLFLLKIAHLFYPFDGKWHGINLGSKYNIFSGLVLCFCFPGIFFAFKQDSKQWLLLFLIFHFIFISIVFYGSPRFRLPLEPYLIMLAVYGVKKIWEISKNKALAIISFSIIFGLNFGLFFFADKITTRLKYLLMNLV